MKTDLLYLIKQYEKEAKTHYDEYAHGDSLARQEAYKKVIEDLKLIIAQND